MSGGDEGEEGRQLVQALYWNGHRLQLDAAHPTHPHTVIVLGDGKLGLLCAQVLHSSGAQVWGAGKRPRKLHLLQKMGLRTALLADWQPAPTDMVVEASASTDGLKLAMDIVRPRGTLVLKSTVAANDTLSLARW